MKPFCRTISRAALFRAAKKAIFFFLPPTRYTHLISVLNYHRYRKMWNPASIARFRSLHQEETIYVVGSGPSLAMTNLNSLRGRPVIFCNAAYKILGQVNPGSSYWVMASGMRMNTFAHVERQQFDASFRCVGAWPTKITQGAISREDIVLRIPVLRGLFRAVDYCPSRFSDDLEKFIYHAGGSSVIFMGIQIAAYMGATKIVLVGADFGNLPGKEGQHYDDSDGLIWTGAFMSQEPAFEALRVYRDHLSRRNVELVNGSTWTTESVLDREDLNLTGEKTS